MFELFESSRDEEEYLERYCDISVSLHGDGNQIYPVSRNKIFLKAASSRIYLVSYFAWIKRDSV